MLCNLCSGFTLHDLLQQDLYKHHAHYIDLFQSAKSGCSLCTYIYRELTQKVVLEFSPAYFYRYRQQYGDEQLYFAREKEESGPLRVKVCQKTNFETYRAIVRLEIFSKEANILSVHGVEVAQEVHEDPSSEESLSRVRSLFDACVHHHADCPPIGHGLTLPTRVLDVGTPDGLQHPRVLETKGRRGNWVALSYSWGGRSASLLSKATMRQFQEGLMLERMPKTLRDAVFITRALGMRYLWIDALCIIQDSLEDWTREAAGMSSIYKNAILTIAAVCSESSGDGFLKPRVCPSWPLVAGGTIAPDLQLYMRPSSFYERDVFHDSLLPQRAWILQETVLSPRILSYAHREFVWGCSEAFRESNLPIGSTSIAAGLGPIASALRSRLRAAKSKAVPMYEHLRQEYSNKDKQAADQFYEGWFQIVENYSGRKLTVPSDVLPALSGLAKEWPRAPEDEYCAGIWRSQLVPGLYWSRESSSGSGVESEKPCHEIGLSEIPSWSWASIQGPQVSFVKGDGMIFPGSIIDVQVVPKLLKDPFYGTTAGFMHVNVPFIRIDDVRVSKEEGSPPRFDFHSIESWLRKEWKTNAALRSEFRQKHVDIDNQLYGCIMIGELPEWSQSIQLASKLPQIISLDRFEQSTKDRIQARNKTYDNFQPPGPFLFLIVQAVDGEQPMDGFNHFRRLGLAHLDLKKMVREKKIDLRRSSVKPKSDGGGLELSISKILDDLDDLDEATESICAELYHMRDRTETQLVLV